MAVFFVGIGSDMKGSLFEDTYSGCADANDPSVVNAGLIDFHSRILTYLEVLRVKYVMVWVLGFHWAE